MRNRQVRDRGLPYFMSGSFSAVPAGQVQDIDGNIRNSSGKPFVVTALGFKNPGSFSFSLSSTSGEHAFSVDLISIETLVSSTVPVFRLSEAFTLQPNVELTGKAENSGSAQGDLEVTLIGFLVD